MWQISDMWRILDFFTLHHIVGICPNCKISEKIRGNFSVEIHITYVIIKNVHKYNCLNDI